ncbi:MAG: radical SAM protein [Clostridia bacterium]|nr:radical SAM protein [Clostridia bacterium]
MCGICPRGCRVNRDSVAGFCGVGNLPVVAKAFLHKWEEPCISGTNGSGTVFFSGCNLKCVYCQNYQISQENFGREVSIGKLRDIYIFLQAKGAHNINLVNPTHFVSSIRDSLIGLDELEIPVVYNSNGYDSIEGLEYMKGVVDVYLPDLKYFSPETAARYSGASDYFDIATRAILEMYAQVGPPLLDSNGVIRRGLIIRHLILPGQYKESIKILDWIRANLPNDIYISLMSQYTPYYKARCHKEIDRRITTMEYRKVVDHLYKLGLENGYVQERESAKEEYIPDFNLEGVKE